MPSPRALLSAALAASLLASPAAHARFGKRTQPKEHTSSSDDKVHEASAIGTDDDDDDEDEEAPSSGSDGDTLEDGSGVGGSFARGVGEQLVGSLMEVMVQALIYAIANGGTHHGGPEEPAEPGERRTLRHAAPLSVRMGSQGLMWRGPGSGADIFLGVEGERLGAEAHVLRLWLPAEDGTGARDYLTLVQAHVSHAVYVSEQLRVRAEGGVSTARGPDATFMGPSLALSLEACVLGPLDVEARAQVTPLPYQQLDGTAGLALHLGGLTLRGGWRGLFLDDQGGVDGIDHQERLHGPYLGAGFTF